MTESARLRFDRFDLYQPGYQVYDRERWLGITFQRRRPGCSTWPWLTNRTGDREFPSRKAAAACLLAMDKQVQA